MYHTDRVDGHGKVFIAFHNILTSNELTFTDSSSELVACKIQLADRSSLSYYMCNLLPSFQQ